MSMFKNMEVVLMFCFGLVCAAALLAQPQQIRAPGNAEAAAMPVVIVVGKRLSATEKAQMADAG